MLSKNRLFERKAPDRSAKSIYIFCEGAKREFQYFGYFKEIDSRINIEIYPLSPTEDNSPNGLLEIAKKSILKSRSNPNPKYEVWEIDEVWIVIDADPDKFDSRVPQIKALREFCQEHNWNVAESNPCFEVWLYYHFASQKPDFEKQKGCNFWKVIQNEFPGGFDSRKHPLFIHDAIENSISTFTKTGSMIDWGSTEVHNLGKAILETLGPKIEQIRKSLS